MPNAAETGEGAVYFDFVSGVFASALRHFKLLSFVFVVAVGAAVAYVMVTDKVYEARVIVTDAERSGAGALGGAGGQLGGLIGLAGLAGLSQESRLQEGLAVLESSAFATQFVQDHDLVEAFAKPDSDDPIWSATHQFLDKALTIDNDVTSGMVTISVRLEDRETAASTANAAIRAVNERIRQRTIDESDAAIVFLNDKINETSSLETKQVLYRLVEAKLGELMIASTRPEFVFRVIDPATVPHEFDYVHPRALLVLMFALFCAAIVSALALLVLDGLRALRASRVD
ncbi:MAG: hypothetical protein AAFS02_02095 [Pseudomonadota bacterium]